MKTIGSYIVALLLFTLIFACIWAITLGLQHLSAHFQSLRTDQASLLVIGSTLLLVCTLILAFAIRYKNPGRELVEQPEKSNIYTDFINYYIEIRNSIQVEGLIHYRFRSDLSLWAGKDVLKAYIRLNKLMGEQKPDYPNILTQAEKVILEMRKDMGLKNDGLKRGDIDGIIFPGNVQTVQPDNQLKIRKS